MKLTITALFIFFCFNAKSQAVVISNDGLPPTDSTALLEIRKAGFSKLKIKSKSYADSSQLEFSNTTSGNLGTSIQISLNKEEGLLFSSTSDILNKRLDSFFSMRFAPNKMNFGLNIKHPNALLHVNDATSSSVNIRLTNSSTGVIGNKGTTLSMTGLNALLLNNEAGLLSLGTNATVWGTFTSTGNFGLGTPAPSEKLEVAGNIKMTSSTKGIILDGQDRPFITRGFDQFTSGNYSGLGRWGVFMEPSRLTLGIAALPGKAFEFASYNTNSTKNTLLNISESGSVTRPATNNANLLPVAFGTIDGTNSAAILNGSGNFTATRVGFGFYSISIAGETISDATHTIMVTVIRNSVSGGTYVWATPSTSPPAGNILVKTGDNSDQKFSFLVFRAN